MDVTAEDLMTGLIHVEIESEADDYLVYEEDIIINTNKIKKGKYTHKSKTGISLKLDTNKGKFTLQGKKINLTGLSCPLSVEIEVGDYC